MYSNKDVIWRTIELFKEKTGNDVDYKECWKTIFDYHVYLRNIMLNTGAIIVFPYRIGSFRLASYVPDKRKIDYLTSKKLGKKVYFDNKNSNGKLIFVMFKNFRNNIGVNNIPMKLWTFLTAKRFKQQIAQYCREHIDDVDYFKFVAAEKKDLKVELDNNYNEFE